MVMQGVSCATGQVRLRGQIMLKVGFYTADSRTTYSRQIHVHPCILDIAVAS